METLVIGGDGFGLVEALRRARRGESVCVLESGDRIGGPWAPVDVGSGTESPWGWFPGVWEVPMGIEALGLEHFGVRWRAAPSVWLPEAAPEGRWLAVDPPESGRAEHPGLWEWIRRVARPLKGLLDAPAPDLGASASMWPVVRHGLALRRLGRRDLDTLMRTMPMSVEDFLSEWVPDPVERAALSMDAMCGGWMGPRSPHGAALWILRAVHVGMEPVGGPAVLGAALVEACVAAGVELRTGRAVERIEVAEGRARGVTLADGRTLPADVVVSARGPKRTLLRWVHPRHLSTETAREIERIRTRSAEAVVHLLVEGAPERGVERVRLVGGPETLERAFDASGNGTEVASSELPLDIRISPLDGEDRSILEVRVFGVSGPAWRARWTGERRAEVVERVVRRLAAWDSSLPARVLAGRLWVSEDVERVFERDGGHPLDGEVALDQLWFMRPTARLVRLGIGIEGLEMVGPGWHFGGCA